MQQGDYSSYYTCTQSPNPNPTANPVPPPQQPPSFASAPPYSANYPPSEYSSSYPSSSYPSFPQNSVPVPTAPAFSPGPNFPPTLPQQQTPQPSSSFPQFETHGSYHQLPPQTQLPPPPPSLTFVKQAMANLLFLSENLLPKQGSQ